MKLTKYNVVKLLNANGWMSRDSIEKTCGIKTKIESVLSNFVDIILELRKEKRLKEDTMFMTGEEIYNIK